MDCHNAAHGHGARMPMRKAYGMQPSAAVHSAEHGGVHALKSAENGTSRPGLDRSPAFLGPVGTRFIEFIGICNVATKAATRRGQVSNHRRSDGEIEGAEPTARSLAAAVFRPTPARRHFKLLICDARTYTAITANGLCSLTRRSQIARNASASVAVRKRWWSLTCAAKSATSCQSPG